MDYVADAFAYCAKGILVTFLQVIIVLGPGVVLGLAMNSVAGYFGRHAYLQMGRTIYIYVFGWLGTAIHEVGHAIFCLLFGHRIVKIEFFNPDPVTGRLGYVRHSYNKDSLMANIGNLFIGIGPILVGTAIIYFLALVLLDINVGSKLLISSSEMGSWNGISSVFDRVADTLEQVFRSIFSLDSASRWELYLFLYLTFSIGVSITLSPSDIRGAFKGFLALVMALILVNLGTLWIGDFTGNAMARLAEYCGVFYAMMLLALILILFTYIVVIACHRLFSIMAMSWRA